MGTSYKRRDRDFESRLAQRADELRGQREAEQQVSDLVWALILLTQMQDERSGS